MEPIEDGTESHSRMRVNNANAKRATAVLVSGKMAFGEYSEVFLQTAAEDRRLL